MRGNWQFNHFESLVSLACFLSLQNFYCHYSLSAQVFH